jgi:hypothetical protein
MIGMWKAQRTLTERWWNGRYGRLGRKEVRLFHEVAERWTVELAEGEIDGGHVKTMHFDSEETAREYVTHCRDTVPGTTWTALTRQPAQEP